MNKKLTTQQIEDIELFNTSSLNDEVLTLYSTGVSEFQTMDERLKQIKKAQYFDLMRKYILESNVEAINILINSI